MQRPRFLLVGPLPHIRAGILGGAVVSFSKLVAFMEQENETFSVINTNRFALGWRKYLSVPYTAIQILYQMPFCDIVFLNSSRNGTRYLAPLLALLARLLGKRFVFRPFGGDLADYIADYPKWWHWLFRHTVLKGDLLLLQTRSLLESFSEATIQTQHLPTTRAAAPTELVRVGDTFQRRFVYLGHIKQSKGIDLLIEVAGKLPEGYTLHLYGPIKEEHYTSLFRDRPGLYQGILRQEEILTRLSAYDVLVLPTHYPGEGYPGSIIEAYSLGLPVIATRWRSIPEIVEDGVTGLLIPAHSAAALLEAIRYFDPQNYPDFSQNAYESFQRKFDTKQVWKKMLTTIKQIGRQP